MNNTKILIFIDWFLPGYKAGGPIQSIANFVNHFHEKFHISIVTSNKDLGEKLPYDNIEPNKWIKKTTHRILYLEDKNLKKSTFQKLLKEEEYDFIYLNSLFSFYFALLPLWIAIQYKIKVVLAPRGMLGAGALQISKRKKQVVLLFLKIVGIVNKISWQATADTESDEIKKHFGKKAKIFLAPNLSAKISEKLNPKKKVKNELNLFFLSRISKKKNLKGAIEFLNKVEDKYKVDFTIIGPVGEIKYWEECKELLKILPQNIRVKVLGPVPNYKLSEILKDQHVLLLPTFHENFGHVILESLQHGCPVLLSNLTPWLNLENKKIGFDIDLKDKSKFVSAIETFSRMDNKEFNQWSLNGFRFAKSFCNSEEVIEKNRNMFLTNQI